MFYTFRQNNSGGHFDINEAQGIGVSVIVEADDKEHAIYLAERIGLYFNGCEQGLDCDCCGDRWSDWIDEGTLVPTSYSDPLLLDGTGEEYWGGPSFVHYKDKSFIKISGATYKSTLEV